MNLVKRTSLRNILKRSWIRLLDWLYLPLDKQYVLRTRNIRRIPKIKRRYGGKKSYAEWAHTIGIFQTLIHLHLDNKNQLRMLDIGCGTGLLAIASEPFLQTGGHYLGIDVRRSDIKFCKAHYPAEQYSFQHLDVHNSAYAPRQPENKARWDVADHSQDIVMALSVWTHFNEEDAIFYFHEIDRVLKPGGKAIVTFFLLDDAAQAQQDNIRQRKSGSRYHSATQQNWVFDQPSSPSRQWFHPAWVIQPEDAIGITLDGLAQMQEKTTLRHIHTYPGNWKEQAGVYFQDILIFEKLDT